MRNIEFDMGKKDDAEAFGLTVAGLYAAAVKFSILQESGTNRVTVVLPLNN